MSGPQEERLSEWSKEADSTPLVEWKQHRNRISTRLGIGEYLQKSPKNEEEDDNDNINELLVTSSSSYDNNILSDHEWKIHQLIYHFQQHHRIMLFIIIPVIKIFSTIST